MTEPTAGNRLDLPMIASLGVLALIGWLLGPAVKSMFPAYGMAALQSFPALLAVVVVYVVLVVAVIVGVSRRDSRLSNTAIGGIAALSGGLALSWLLAPA